MGREGPTSPASFRPCGISPGVTESREWDDVREIVTMSNCLNQVLRVNPKELTLTTCPGPYVDLKKGEEFCTLCTEVKKRYESSPKPTGLKSPRVWKGMHLKKAVTICSKSFGAGILGDVAGHQRDPTVLCIRSDKNDVWVANADTLRDWMTTVRTICSSAADNPNDNYIRFWFGDTVANDKRDAVVTHTRVLRDWLRGCSVFVFKTTSEFDLMNSRVNKKGRVFRPFLKDDRKSIHCRNGPTLGMGRHFTNPKYSDGEVVCSIIHELTHLCIRTDDNKDDMGYGADLCRNMALSNDEAALTNAETWAYYLCQYRTGQEVDWANMTVGDYYQRRTGKTWVEAN
jgi:hypothetical protein